LFRLARLVLHIADGVATTAVIFPFRSPDRRVEYVQRWSARLLAILAVRTVTNGVPASGTAPAMFVANHVSWLDIVAINALRPVRFIAKSEIRRWPVVGWLCSQNGTLFIERSRRQHIAHINRAMTEALIRGDTFAVFPEGVISTGDKLLPFHASLLQPALDCDAMLHPIALRYTRADGSLCAEADYEGAKTLVESLWLMLTQPVIHLRVEFLAPLACAEFDRRGLAHAAAQKIASALGVPAPRTRAEKVSGPPA
jgi:1-acyl-sn-glycerol-3-phosphate acyltransferase